MELFADLFKPKPRSWALRRSSTTAEARGNLPKSQSEDFSDGMKKKPAQKQSETLFDTAPEPSPKKRDSGEPKPTHYRCIYDGCSGRILISENVCPKCGREQCDF